MIIGLVCASLHTEEYCEGSIAISCVTRFKGPVMLVNDVYWSFLS